MPTKIKGTRNRAEVGRERAMQDTLLGMDTEDSDEWFDSNIKTLQDMKSHQKRLTKIMIAMAHKLNKQG